MIHFQRFALEELVCIAAAAAVVAGENTESSLKAEVVVGAVRFVEFPFGWLRGLMAWVEGEEGYWGRRRR